MPKNVQVRGADRVAATMRAAARDLETMTESSDEYARVLADTARGNAPVRTGRLRRSITAEQARVTAGAPYAAVIEYGSRRRGITARRYMARAAETTDRERDTIYTRGAENALDQIKGA